MLTFATATRNDFYCDASEEDWKQLRQQLAKSEPKFRNRRQDRIRKDQLLVAAHKQKHSIVMQLRDAIAVELPNEDLANPDTVRAKRERNNMLMEAAIAMGVANEVRGGRKAYTTKLELEPTGETLTDNMMESPKFHKVTSDDGKYDPARMEEDEDDRKYFDRLKWQADPVLDDSQPVLDVTAWVVGRPTVEGAKITNHPITGDPVGLPKRSYLIWPSAIRYQSIQDDPQKDYIVVDEYERNYKLGQDMLPAREPVSRLNVVGESDGYLMPPPVLDTPTRIYAEPNARLRKLRQKRNFDLQQEIADAIKRRVHEGEIQLAKIEGVIKEMRDLAPFMRSVGIEVPQWLMEVSVKQDAEPYRIPESEIIANRIEMLKDLDRRRCQRVINYVTSKYKK